jgi:SAM-dependent methyltransferase
VVESVGVLHHLADPAAGVARLAAVLAPGGWALIGLYSRLGRAAVHAAQADLADLSPTPAGLREARRRILAFPADHPGRGAAFSPDLYTATGARDLLFHPCEHHYCPSEVGALLTSAGLAFEGLQHARPEARALYRERWPEDRLQADLLRWDEIECLHPTLFGGMILAWARRPGSLRPRTPSAR